MNKLFCPIFFAFIIWGSAGRVTAQETSPPLTQTDNTTASPLQGTIPANTNFLGNGVQFNGISNSPACNKSVCGYIQHQITPTGNTSTVGLTFQLGGSADDTRAEAEKAKVEIDNIRASREFKIQLMQSIASALEAKQCLRARIFSQELAKILGYNSHWDYLKDIDAHVCMR